MTVGPNYQNWNPPPDVTKNCFSYCGFMMESVYLSRGVHQKCKMPGQERVFSKACGLFTGPLNSTP